MEPAIAPTTPEGVARAITLQHLNSGDWRRTTSMQLTRFTDYSLRTLIFLGAHPDRLCTIAQIAAASLNAKPN